MDIREFFFWVASITLILTGLLVIAIFALIFYIKKLADRTAARVLAHMDSMSESVATASRAWRNLSVTRFILRLLKYLF